MSGGSHCYLYLATDPADLCQKQDVLIEVRDEIKGLVEQSDSPNAIRALQQTQEVIDGIEHLRKLMENETLTELWRALEWNASGDDCETFYNQLYNYPLENA